MTNRPPRTTPAASAFAILAFCLLALAAPRGAMAQAQGAPAIHEGRVEAARAEEHGGTPGEAHAGGHAEVHGPEPLTLLIYSTNFTLFLVALVWLARKPVGDLLRERKAGILKEMEEAAAEREKAERLLAEVEQRLARIEAEARAILEQSEREAAAERERLLAEARAAADRMRKLAEFTIDQERKKAVLAVREEAANLAVRLAEGILKEKMTEEDHKRLIRDFLDHVRGVA